MTFTSFNPTQFNQVENTSGNQPLTIKQGQVFHGTIKKLYPDQTAEVQIGNHKMIAKLEVPLKAGDSYFLQVKNINPQIELSLISNTSSSISTQDQINQLIESMNLPKGAEAQQLLKFLLKNQIPIVKEQLQDALQWIKNLPKGVSKQEAFLALQKMLNDKLPFQQQVFHALLFGTKTSGILQDITSFTAAINGDNHLSNDVKAALSNILQKIATPIEGEISGEVLKRAVQTLQNTNVNIEHRLAILNILKESNILPKSATLQNWQMTSFNQIIQESGQLFEHASQIVKMLHNTNESNITKTIENVKEWLQHQPIQQDQKNSLMKLLNNFQNTQKDKQSIEQFAHTFHRKLIEVFSKNEFLFSLDKTGVTTKEHLMSLLKPSDGQEYSQLMNLLKIANETEHPVIQNMILQAEQQVQSALDSNAMQFALKTILKNMGLSYEAKLNNQELETITNTLKPQLLSLLQNVEASQNVKENAEILLSRLNGMQIVSNEQNHQQQVIMQIPLHFLGKKMDATVQWNGRMKENGKIDANYARILFYLNMESLQETVIDMQVQNRIVTIQFFNQNENLEFIAEPFKKLLKEGLAEKEYHLSGIFFKQFKDNEQQSSEKKESIEHSGVDIRI